MYDEHETNHVIQFTLAAIRHQQELLAGHYQDDPDRMATATSYVWDLPHTRGEIIRADHGGWVSGPAL